MDQKIFKKNKNKFRPLTTKEKYLISILVIILVFWASNRFILTPQAEKLSKLESERIELDLRLNEINATLKRENLIKKEYENLLREKNETITNFFSTLDQSQIIYFLNDLLSDKDIAITDLSFNRPATEKIKDMNIQHMGISIPISGDYDGISSIVKSLDSSPRRILIDSLTMDKAGEELIGNISLKIYSLEGIVETDGNFINVNIAEGSSEGSMFDEYEGYIDEDTKNESKVASSEIDDSNYTKVYLLHDFETKDYYFIPSNDLIKGDVSPSTTRKSGKYSLRFEYNILALEDENRAYIDLSSKDIELKYPPDKISMWVYSYGYLPGTMGIRLRTQTGEDIDVIVSNGISWVGWSNIEADMPHDLSLYPLKLTHLYYELPFNRDDIGVMLINKLEALYPVNEDGEANKKPLNDFYVVQPGDTVSSISRKVYGTIKYKNEIIQNNSLTSGDILPVGKVLVLVRR
jgi:type IV pilus assembly protein PilO